MQTVARGERERREESEEDLVVSPNVTLAGHREPWLGEASPKLTFLSEASGLRDL